MKPNILGFLVCGCLTVYSTTLAHANVQIVLGSGILYQNNGTTPMADGGLLLLVASTTDSVFTAPSSTSFNPGSDDSVVASFTLNSSSGGSPGSNISTLTLSYSGNFGVGDPLELLWFPALTSTATAPGNNTNYGAFRTDTVQDGSTIAWVAPTDSSSYTLNFLTTALGGSNPESAGVASFTVVPEPSTYAFLGLGLAGLTFGVMRRRQRQVTA